MLNEIERYRDTTDSLRRNLDVYSLVWFFNFRGFFDICYLVNYIFAFRFFSSIENQSEVEYQQLAGSLKPQHHIYFQATLVVHPCFHYLPTENLILSCRGKTLRVNLQNERRGALDVIYSSSSRFLLDH